MKEFYKKDIERRDNAIKCIQKLFRSTLEKHKSWPMFMKQFDIEEQKKLNSKAAVRRKFIRERGARAVSSSHIDSGTVRHHTTFITSVSSPVINSESKNDVHYNSKHSTTIASDTQESQRLCESSVSNATNNDVKTGILPDVIKKLETEEVGNKMANHQLGFRGFDTPLLSTTPTRTFSGATSAMPLRRHMMAVNRPLSVSGSSSLLRGDNANEASFRPSTAPAREKTHFDHRSPTEPLILELVSAVYKEGIINPNSIDLEALRLEDRDKFVKAKRGRLAEDSDRNYNR